MFVYLPRWSRRGTVAMLIAMSACGTPDLNSDLRPDGPPEVLSVLTNTPDNRPGYAGTGSTVEDVTFCKKNDDKRPTQVILIDESAIQYCDDDPTKDHAEITNALPEAWYARIQFDELLDPSIEDLVANLDADGNPDGTYSGTLANTKPVTLQCQSSVGNTGALVDIPYDGYYSPSGNSISYPVGPSLVIQPADPTLVATGSECQVTLKDNIKDKDGNQVPADQRGPYKFKIGQVEVVAISPADGDSIDPMVGGLPNGVDITFNTAIDPAGVDNANWSFDPAIPNSGVIQESGEEFLFTGDMPAGAGPITFSFLQGAMIPDQCGKVTTLGAPSVDNFTQTSFTTNDVRLVSLTGAAEPGNMINLLFNQFMDETTLTEGTDFTISPTPANLRVEQNSTGAVRVAGDFALATSYTFTFKNGAAVDDCPGGEFGSCVKSQTFTNPSEQSVTFTTAAAIALKSVTPADNFSDYVGNFTTGINLTFNDNIDPTSVDPSDYTLDGPAVVLTAGNRGDVGRSYETIRLNAPGGVWPPGDYTFTLKSTAVLKDRLGNSFSPSADKVIHFHLDPDPTGTAPACY